jgi:hypothetical protein
VVSSTQQGVDGAKPLIRIYRSNVDVPDFGSPYGTEYASSLPWGSMSALERVAATYSY